MLTRTVHPLVVVGLFSIFAQSLSIEKKTLKPNKYEQDYTFECYSKEDSCGLSSYPHTFLIVQKRNNLSTDKYIIKRMVEGDKEETVYRSPNKRYITVIDTRRYDKGANLDIFDLETKKEKEDLYDKHTPFSIDLPKDCRSYSTNFAYHPNSKYACVLARRRTSGNIKKLILINLIHKKIFFTKEIEKKTWEEIKKVNCHFSKKKNKFTITDGEKSDSYEYNDNGDVYRSSSIKKSFRKFGKDRYKKFYNVLVITSSVRPEQTPKAACRRVKN